MFNQEPGQNMDWQRVGMFVSKFMKLCEHIKQR